MIFINSNLFIYFKNFFILKFGFHFNSVNSHYIFAIDFWRDLILIVKIKIFMQVSYFLIEIINSTLIFIHILLKYFN